MNKGPVLDLVGFGLVSDHVMAAQNLRATRVLAPIALDIALDHRPDTGPVPPVVAKAAIRRLPAARFRNPEYSMRHPASAALWRKSKAPAKDAAHGAHRSNPFQPQ